MKLAPLLAQYLYTHKRLDLPGIGSFLLSSYATVEPEINKQGKPINPEGISFENNPSIKDAPELIQFIADQTGKIKALAAADLDSHLGNALQFMNLGKPFLFEGIGNLVKTQSREFAYSAGQVMPDSMKEYSARELSSTSSMEETFADYRNPSAGKAKFNWKRPLAVFLILAGLALAIWGGYTVYKRSIAKKKSVITPVEYKEENVIPKDSITILKKDTVTAPVQTIPAISAAPAGTQKFILEVSNAKRAFERFGKLKTFQWNVSMETKDSVLYTIYMLLPVAAADTTRVLDSLSMLNGRRVYIQK